MIKSSFPVTMKKALRYRSKIRRPQDVTLSPRKDSGHVSILLTRCLTQGWESGSKAAIIIPVPTLTGVVVGCTVLFAAYIVWLSFVPT